MTLGQGSRVHSADCIPVPLTSFLARAYRVAADINLLLGFFDVDTLHRLSAKPIEKC